MYMAKVVRRAIGEDGKVIGSPNDNPILNTLIYDVEFTDGVTKQYAANFIAENILSGVDKEGYHSKMVKGGRNMGVY